MSEIDDNGGAGGGRPPSAAAPSRPGARYPRRSFLGGALGVAAAGPRALGRSAAGRSAPAAARSAPAAGRSAPAAGSAPLGPRPVDNPPRIRYQSRPDLLPPSIQRSATPSVAAVGSFLLTPGATPAAGLSSAEQVAKGLGEPGLMILSQAGKLVWFQPTDQTVANLEVQSYRGERVLSYWEGIVENDVGRGRGYILDSSYRTIATVEAGNGLQADFHALMITPEDTVLLSAYTTRPAD
ncbi:MAG TPA: hypothetical protein VMD59_16055, partial [Acidimicrobiales bacterium]|nr:hypothetical protein [Acidimicrobiales bacterium]